MSPKLALVSDHPLAHGGGRERSIVELYHSLKRMGHDVTIIAPPGGGDIQRKVDVPFISASRIELTTDRLLEQGFVDTAIYNTEDLRAAISAHSRLRQKQVLFVRDVEEVRRWGAGSIPGDVRLMANSHFVASRIWEKTGQRAEVVEPQFDFAANRPVADGTYVTFINPVRKKGLEVACAIARLLPHRKFRFVEGWKQVDSQRSVLQALLVGLPNVEFVPWRRDVEKHYLGSRVLLVPSQWEEGFGRVAVEANAYGVPVLASDIGGLPEAVGQGGCLIDPKADAGEWAIALEAMFEDGRHRAELLAGAAENVAYHLARSQSAAGRVIEFVSAKGGASAKAAALRLPARPALPCVDVIMTHYNYTGFVGTAISSVLAQSYGDFRLTIIDDRSHEDERSRLVDIVEGFDDPRIRLMLGEVNKGQIGAFVDAFHSSSSEFVALIDPDDVYAPDFLKLMLSAHLNPVRVAPIATCEMVTFQHGSGDLTRFFSRTRQAQRLEPSNASDSASASASAGANDAAMQGRFGYAKYYPPGEKAWVWGTTSSLMCRRSFIENIIPDGEIRFRFDLDTYLSFGCHVQGGTLFVDTPLAGRGRHGANVAFANEIFSDVQNRNKTSFLSGMSDLHVAAMRQIAVAQKMGRDEILEFAKLLPREERSAFLVGMSAVG